MTTLADAWAVCAVLDIEDEARAAKDTDRLASMIARRTLERSELPGAHADTRLK